MLISARRLGRFGLPLALALVVGVFWAWPGAAQADGLIEMEPPAGEIVGELPEAIVLTFDAPLLLEPGVNSVAIVDAAGVRVDDAQAQVATYSARTLLVRPAPGLEAEGELRVVWQVTFAGSGEQVQGEAAFVVQHGAEPPVAEAAAPGPPRSGESIVIWTLVVIIGAGLFALLLYNLRVATGNARSSLDLPDETH